jgi:hypothetical protein
MIGFRYVRSAARAEVRNGNPIVAADAAEAFRTKRRRVIIWPPLIFCGRVLRKRENIAVSDYKVDCFPRCGANPTGSPFDERPGLGARFRMQVIDMLTGRVRRHPFIDASSLPSKVQA